MSNIVAVYNLDQCFLGYGATKRNLYFSLLYFISYSYAQKEPHKLGKIFIYFILLCSSKSKTSSRHNPLTETVQSDASDIESRAVRCTLSSYPFILIVPEQQNQKIENLVRGSLGYAVPNSIQSQSNKAYVFVSDDVLNLS